jgi:hypothetical protein
MRSSFIPASLAFILALAACSSDDGQGDDTPPSVVARVDGSEAFVAFVSDGSTFFAYVCDGTPAGVMHTSWFVGGIVDGAFAVMNPGGSKLDGRTGDPVTGTYTPVGGSAQSFTAQSSVAPSGLYFGERGEGDAEQWGGWVVIGTEQRGAVVNRKVGDIIGNPAIDPAMSSVDVDGMPLDYMPVEEPIGEMLDDIPPG